MPTEELYGGYNYVFQVGSVTVGRCAKVDGLARSESNVTSPGVLGNRRVVTLSAFISGPDRPARLRAWWDRNYSGPLSPKSGTLLRVNRQGQTLERWRFTNAIPCKWTGSEFDASKNEVSIETLEIAAERIDHG